MAVFAREIRTTDRETRQMVSVDYLAVETRTKPKRPGRPRRTYGDRCRRRYILWLGLVNSGMSYREIADDTGFAASTIHDGVAWARQHGAEWLRRQGVRRAG
jgi:hypothetical protein